MGAHCTVACSANLPERRQITRYPSDKNNSRESPPQSLQQAMKGGAH